MKWVFDNHTWQFDIQGEDGPVIDTVNEEDGEEDEKEEKNSLLAEEGTSEKKSDEASKPQVLRYTDIR